MEADKLREYLHQDTETTEDAEALLPVLTALTQWQPAPTAPAEVAGLLATLQPDLPPPPQRWRTILANSLLGLILWTQLRLVHRELWVASVLVMLVGTGVTLARHTPYSSADNVPIVLIAPIITAMGVAFIYGPTIDPPFEILLTTPFSTRLVLLARLVLVFGFNLVVAVLCSVLLTLGSSQITLWELVVAWLAPMTFLSAFAFCLGLVSKQPLLGALTSLVLWFLQFMDVRDLYYLTLPDLTTGAARPMLFLLAVILGGFALWLIGKEEHWLGEMSL